MRAASGVASVVEATPRGTILLFALLGLGTEEGVCLQTGSSFFPL